MALSRKLLEGFGIDEKQIDTIIEAHMETVNGIMSERDKYKDQADKVPELEKKIEEMDTKSNTNDDWKKKYNDEHKAYEDYKASVLVEKKEAQKVQAYKEMLVDAGVDPRRIDKIMKITDLSNVVLNDDGKLNDREKLVESAKNEWSDFIVQNKQKGSDPATPPETDKGIPGADPRIAERMKDRNDRMFGKIE